MIKEIITKRMEIIEINLFSISEKFDNVIKETISQDNEIKECKEEIN